MTRWQRLGMYLFGMGIGIQVGLSVNGIVREHPFALTIMSTIGLVALFIGYWLGFAGSSREDHDPD
jgi:hypothetical protein